MKAIVAHEAEGKSWRVGHSVIIGRDPQAAIRIEAPAVSREHGMIMRLKKAYYFFDLGSLNGSKVNGHHVDRPVRLAHGDRIELASSELAFYWPKGHADGSSPSESTQAELDQREMIILVADIENYVEICHERRLSDLAVLMAAWYQHCREVLHAAGADIDKFIGDCVFAYWASTDAVAHRRAVEAARALYQCQCPSRLGPCDNQRSECAVRCGVSLHVGMPMVGAVAPGTRTAIGDDVNLAFRLEGVTRKLRVPVVASEAFLAEWEEGRELFEPGGAADLKGFPGLNIFTLKPL